MLINCDLGKATISAEFMFSTYPHNFSVLLNLSQGSFERRTPLCKKGDQIGVKINLENDESIYKIKEML